MTAINKKLLQIVGLISALFISSFASAKTVHYDLQIARDPVNLSGLKTVDWALTVNGGIPAPTLEFTEGDNAEITVVNQLRDEEVSLHWHGILLPPEMDGVAYVNTPPILPGKTFTFKFQLRQSGTYWYHSHTGLQEQKGVYGAIVIHPRKPTLQTDREAVVMLSDWSDENPDQIARNLRKDGDYYQYKKNSVRSILGAANASSLNNYFKNEWTRMGGMDLSDVGYDAFLINGKKDSQLLVAHPGEKVRLRIVNAGSSSYFTVSLAGLPMKVVAADGVDVAPITVNEILLGMAETYDVIFEIPEHKNFELRATSQDVMGSASAWIGMGEKVFAKTKEKPDLYMSMDHSEHADHSAHQAHADLEAEASHDGHSGHQGQPNHEGHSIHEGHSTAKPVPKLEVASVQMLTVDDLRAKQSTVFPSNVPRYDLKLVLGGDMRRYVWHINGETIAQDRNLEIRQGDVIRIMYVNETMMHHPMHLHGHFFRVVNEGGDLSPLKHTVDVPPHGSRTIEFLANEPGEWMLHCHNLYHMKAGMARVVKYSSFTPSHEIAHFQKHDPHAHEHIYYAGRVEAATNHAQFEFQASRSWDSLNLHLENRHLEKAENTEGDLFYRRYLSNYLNFFAGGTYFNDYDENKARAVVGVGYLLPLLIETDLMIDQLGKLRLDLEKRFQWTSTVFTEAQVSFRDGVSTEFEVTLMYGPSWNWAAGLMFTEDKVGIGAHYKF